MSLTVFLLLSVVLAVSVGLLASSLLRSLMKDQCRLEIKSNEAKIACSNARASQMSTSQTNTSKVKNKT